MRYTGSLVKKEREEVFKLFLDRHKLKFSDIEKKLQVRSNMLAYHLEQMRKEGLLQKQGVEYSLTREGEKYIPIFAHVTGQTLSPLPVILIAAVHKGKILLVERKKRPYQGHLGLVGGKIRFEEEIAQAAERKLREHGVDGKFESLRAIMEEKVMDEGKVKHSFLLFFVTCKVEKILSKDLRFATVKQAEKLGIIPSDLWLLQKKLGARIPVHSSTMQESDGTLCCRL